MPEHYVKIRCCLRLACTTALLIVLSAAGCHDHSALEKQLADLRKDLQQIRTVQGNGGIMLEDIDNRLLLLHDQVDSNRLMLDSGIPPASLPVVRLQPSTGPIYPAEVVRAVEAPSPVAEPVPERTPEPVVVEPVAHGSIQFQVLDQDGHVVASGDGVDDLPATAEAAAGPEDTAPRPTPRTKSDDTRALHLYKKGMALLKDKRHRDAVGVFEDFLSQFPKHGYADNCTYWIGEAYYDRQMFHKALARFEQVVVQYPRGNKVPDAILKAGFCYSSLGLQDRAVELFTKLMNMYPGTPAARLAEKRKAELL